MIRADRELLVELAQLNRALAPLAMRIMDGSASTSEQQDYARCLIAAGERLLRRADNANSAVIDGEVLGSDAPALPLCTSKSHRES